MLVAFKLLLGVFGISVLQKGFGPSAGPDSVSNGKPLWPDPIHPPLHAGGQTLNSFKEWQIVSLP